MIRRPALLLTCALLVPEVSSAITSGQVDNFEAGTTMSWAEGFFSPNPPTNVTTGGPAGVNDNYLRNVSSGQVSSPGGKMIMFNANQWAGNYVAAGVTGIQMSLRNFGATPLAIRIAFEGTDATQYGSASAFNLPADGQWHTATFGLGGGDLGLIAGTATVNQALTAVNTLRILSRVSGPGWLGDEIAGTLGVDNITATGASGVGDPVLPNVRHLVNAPNPFPRATTIRYELLVPSPVHIEVFDLAGRSVGVVESAASKSAGSHEVVWDGRDVAGAPVRSGVYFYRLTSSTGGVTRKMLVIRE